MAVDASIPLSGIAPPIMGPAQQLQLREIARQMRVREGIQQVVNTPGMYEKGLPTDQGLVALGRIDQSIMSSETQRRAAQLATESLERQRSAEAARKIEGDRLDALDDVMSGGVGAYYNTPGSPEQKQAAMMKHINSSMDEWEKSGTASRYGMTQDQIRKVRSFNSVDDISTRLLAHGKKEVVERQDLKEAARVAGGGGTPIKDVGKEPPKDAVTGQPIPESVDPKSGAVVRGIDQTPSQGQEIAQGEPDPKAGEQTYKSEVTPEGVKVEDTAVTAKPYKGDTVEGLRQQAQAKEAQASRLRTLGTKAGNNQAKESEQQADKLRSAAVALETRDQKDTDQEMARKRLGLAVEKASKTQEPLDPETAELIGEAVAKGNYALAAGLARNQVAQKQVKEAMGKYARDHGMSATDLNIAHANFSGAMQENRTLGGRAAQMAIPVNEMKQFIPMAESAINKVPRTQFLPLNKLIEMYQTGTTSPEQRDLILAVQGVRNAYAQVVSRGGISVHSQELSEHALQSADSPQAFKAALRRMWAEAEGGRKAINQSQKEAGGSIRGDEFKMDPYPGEPDQKGKGGTYVKEKKAKPIEWSDEKEKELKELEEWDRKRTK